MWQMIEKEVGLKACVVYGALPPEMRREQARLFNDPDSDFKVRQTEGRASDACAAKVCRLENSDLKVRLAYRRCLCIAAGGCSLADKGVALCGPTTDPTLACHTAPADPS